MPPDPKECLLCNVFCHRAVQAHPSQIGEDPVLMRDHDPLERLMVTPGALADVRVTVQDVAPDLPYILAPTPNGYRTTGKKAHGRSHGAEQRQYRPSQAPINSRFVEGGEGIQRQTAGARASGAVAEFVRDAG